MAIPGIFLLYFRSFNTDLLQSIENKICQCLELNIGSLVLLATALPTEPQPPPET